MGSNLSTVLVTFALLGAMLTACKPTQPMKTFKKAVTQADTLMLYQVEEYPTAPSLQQTGQYYLHDFATRGRQELTVAEMQDLKTILIDSTTFDSATVKSCPMLAKAAIELHCKGKSTMTFVLSPSPCGKVLIFDSPKSIKPKCMDLAVGNRLEAIIFK